MIKNYFICDHCKKKVSLSALGTVNRNHCNFCLWSKHVDEKIGDRKSKCNGEMQPIDVSFKKNGELMLVHKCLNCGKVSSNRISGDDNTDEIMKIAEKSKSLNVRNKKEIKTQLFGLNV